MSFYFNWYNNAYWVRLGTRNGNSKYIVDYMNIDEFYNQVIACERWTCVFHMSPEYLISLSW